MKYLVLSSLLAASLFSTLARSEDFTGVWSIDSRTNEQRKNHVECGAAFFTLTQINNTITGTHDFATAYCGRLNESGAVEGFVKGSTATLVVTSGRNGEKVKGRAILKNDKLYWKVLKRLSPGDPPNDGLILAKGVLTRKNSK
jgi:hypothetical protein